MFFALAKTIHIIGFISWFTGLFAIVRLYIYHQEAGERPAAEAEILRAQSDVMQARMWKIITTPAMFATIAAGLWTVHEAYGFAHMPGWLHLKLALIGGLVIYHHICGRIRKQQAARISTWSSRNLRLFNELATMFMASIVALAVFKSGMSALWGAVGLLCLGLALMAGITVYRRVLAKKTASEAPR